MKLLLDTHIWLWSLLDPSRLTARVRRALEHADNELWLSPVSTWEVVLLAAKKRVVFDEGVEGWVRRAQTAVPFHEALLTHDIALATRNVTLSLRDPADRFLVATARVLDLTLVTADAQLIKARAAPTLANR